MIDFPKLNKSKPSPQPHYISIPEYAQSLGISRIAVYQRVKKGLIPAKKIGRNYVIETSQKDVPATKYLSVAQFAKRSGISRIAVFQKIKRGQISAFKCGRNYLVRADMPAAELKTSAPKKQKKQPKKTQPFISIPELARELGLSRIDIYQKVKAGTINAEKIGRNYVIDRKSVYAASAKPGFRKGVLAKNYISIAQLARETGVSRITIYNRIKQGLIKARKAGRNFVIKKEDVLFKT